VTVPNKRNSHGIPAGVALLLTIPVLLVWGVDREGSVSGVVKTSADGPAVGAVVRVKNTDLGLTVSAISQDAGTYTVPNLPAGTYRIWATGGGSQSDPNDTIEVSGNAPAAKNLTLTTRQKLTEAMTSSQFAALMPPGEGKDLIVSLCTHCHKDGTYKIVSRRLNRDGWTEAIRKMETNVFGNTHPVELTDRDRMVILDYLVKNYGPDTPPLDADQVMAKTWITGPAGKSVATEFDLPSGSGPHDVVVDSQGIAWVGETNHGVIGRLDPETLTYTRIPIPGSVPNKAKRSITAAHALALDAQGRLWLSDHRTSRAIQYDPKTEKFTFYPYPAAENAEDSTDVNTIRIHPNGTVWFTDLGADQILRLDPVTKVFTKIAIPASAHSAIKAHPYGMAIDGAGWIWFAEYEASKMGRVDAKSGEVTEYKLPATHLYPRRMGTDANGNVWFGEYGGIGKLVMVDRRTAKMTEYPTPSKYSGAYSVSVDMKRNLIWVNELISDKIARFDPRTKTFVEYPMPTYFSSVRRIEADPSRPNRVWYSGQNSNRIGYLDVFE
jgi:virginiamycin B lyase